MFKQIMFKKAEMQKKYTAQGVTQTFVDTLTYMVDNTST